MLPLLAGPRRLSLYLAAWVPLAGLLAVLLALSGGFGWAAAAAVALPLCVVYAFVCLAAGYVGRAAPVEAAGLLRILATHAAVAVVSSSLWVLAGRGWARLLEAAELVPGARDAYARAAPLLTGFGILVFLLATALHYALAAYEASRQAETRALELELLSREAELKSIRSQIHPHFLFNALNSISALTSRDPAEARRVCVLLADFLRRSLTVGARDAIPLAEELELATSLLAIEKVRFGARLDYQVLADAPARACLVPALLLQPLVENAVTHGIASRLEGGTVRIEARRNGEQLELAVANPRDLDGASRAGTGLGLPMVRRRLEALYGPDAFVSVEARPESFRVRLGLPARLRGAPPEPA